MVVVLTLLLLIVVLAFVGYPLLRPAVLAAAGPAAPAEEQRAQLLGERENVLSTLKDLELEHSIGNLSDGDYDALRAAQRHKAVAIFRAAGRLRPAGMGSAVWRSGRLLYRRARRLAALVEQRRATRRPVATRAANGCGQP